jgi:hypothetical protein
MTIKRRKRRRKTVKRRKTFRAGSQPIKVDCCICRKNKVIGTTLIPRKCLNKNGVSSHRICQKCWWKPETGFASEGVIHDCPGCVKKLPLNKNKNHDEVIDLTEDE